MIILCGSYDAVRCNSPSRRTSEESQLKETMYYLSALKYQTTFLIANIKNEHKWDVVDVERRVSSCVLLKSDTLKMILFSSSIFNFRFPTKHG